ncbi:hypothetical protein NMG60_11002348 [Bertholletia excelsa]
MTSMLLISRQSYDWLTEGGSVSNGSSTQGSQSDGDSTNTTVAEGYEKGKTVGYAQISTGIDFYIYPRSEVIISKARSSHASLPSQSDDNDFVDDETNN